MVTPEPVTACLSCEHPATPTGQWSHSRRQLLRDNPGARAHVATSLGGEEEEVEERPPPATATQTEHMGSATP